MFSKAIDTIAIVAFTFADHALFVNDKAGKSEAMAHITIQTKAARLHIAQRGPLVVHYGRAKPLTIHMVGKYKHLGGQVVANSDMYEEVCYRSGTARSIEKAVGRSIFGNPDLDSTKRMLFLRSLSQSRLFFNSGTWSHLSGKSLKQTYGVLAPRVTFSRFGPQT